jgi:hypothetical protein
VEHRSGITKYALEIDVAKAMHALSAVFYYSSLLNVVISMPRKIGLLKRKR